MRTIIIFLILILYCCKTGNSYKKLDSNSNQKKMDKQSVTIIGTAYNAKLGAIISTDAKEIYYIERLDSWPDEIVGKKLKATGILKKEYYDDGDLVNDKGEYKQGLTGEKLSLSKLKWEIITDNK